MRIPQDVNWNQVNQGDYSGSLWATKNIDFTKKRGVLALAKKANAIKTGATGTATDIGIMVAIVYGAFRIASDEWFFVSNRNIYYGDSDLDTFTRITTTPQTATANGSDAVAWRSRLYYSTDTSLTYLSGGAFTDVGAVSTTTTLPHPLCVNNRTNELYIGNGPTLHKLTSGDAFSTALTLPANYEIRWIRQVNNYFAIGTRNKTNDDAIVSLWDGVSTLVSGDYTVKGSWAYSGVNYDGILHIVTNLGKIQRLNSNGFEDVADFPNYNEDFKYTWSNSGFGSVHQRGLAVIKGRLYIGLTGRFNEMNTTTTSGQFTFPQMPSGVWVYEPSYGLTHQAGSSYSDDFGHHFGDLYPCLISELYTGSTGGIVYQTDVATSYVFSGSAYSNASYYTVTSLIESVNRGYFVTSRFPSPNQNEKWQKLYIKYGDLSSTDDKIMVKYRTDKPVSYNFQDDGGNLWTGVTERVFTTTNADMANVEVGWEVEIINGKGAGCLAHIASISEDGGTYTVTLDEAIPNVVDAERLGFIVQNFLRIPSQSGNLYQTIGPDTNGQVEISLGQTSKEIQFKIELRGQQIEIEELNLINTSNKPSV